MALIAFGSVYLGGKVAVAAPTDGQTLMVVGPLFGFSLLIAFTMLVYAKREKKLASQVFAALTAMGLVVGIAYSMVLSDKAA